MERNEPQQNDADLRALFQSKFENEEQVVPAQSWAPIEKKLFRNNRFRFYYLGLSGLLVVSTFIGIQLNDTKQTSLNKTKVNTSIIQQQNTKNKTNLPNTKKQAIQEPASLKNIQQQSLMVEAVSQLEQKNPVRTIQTKKLTITHEALSAEILTSKASNKAENELKNEQTTINTPQTELENKPPLYLNLIPLMQIAVTPVSILSGQKPLEKIRKKQMYYMGLVIGGGIRIQEINGNFNSNHPNTKDLVDRNIPMRNKHIGLDFGYQLTKKLSIETGLFFNRYTFESKWFTKEIEDKADNDSYEFSTNDGNLKIAAAELNDYFQTSSYTLLNVKVNHSSSSLLLPITVRYDFSVKKFHPYLKLGIALERINNNVSLLNIEKDGNERTFVFKGNDVIRKNTLNAMLAVGGSYVLSPSWRFNAELNYYRTLTKVVETSKMSINSSNLQLKVGLNYIF
jgi:outer membrane protein W